MRPRITNEGVSIEALGGRISDQKVDPFHVTLAPHSHAGAAEVVHSGQEFVYCLRGVVEYQVEGIPYTLAAGDFLLFHAELPHSWCNPTEEPAEMLLVLQAAEPAGQPVRGHFPAMRSLQYAG